MNLRNTEKSRETDAVTAAQQSEDLVEAVRSIADQSQDLMQDFYARQGARFDVLGLQQAFLDLTTSLMRNPEKLIEVQQQAWNAWTDLWLDTYNRMLDGVAESPAGGGKPDRRFRHDAWENNPFFDFVRQSYLITANAIQGVVQGGAEGLDEKTAKKIEFYTRQYIDALSPSNFAHTNPEVIEQTLRTRGGNLLKGLQNFCEDLDPVTGQLRIRMTDMEAFELGKNIALSEGKVVFQNELMQLIQYAPLTEEVYERPVLIIPPWINKFYILDLQPKNSLIRWLTSQGHTVFVISWVNPDATLGHKDFEDYVFDGPLAALDAMNKAVGTAEANVIGYCIGGTLLAATLAYMRARNDRRIVSATFLASLIDFSEPGDLGVFIDEHQLSHLEDRMNERGYHDGREMALTFNMLRANDLIWSYYVNNYLLGKEPMPFDLLYWNADSTRMPAKMHGTYLRKMYHENLFKEPGGFHVGDVAIDVSGIDTPAYFISTLDDHIAPWKSTYLGARLLSGPVRFVLGKSGHIAGIINPPEANKYGYHAGPSPEGSPETWFEAADYAEGSWWPDWQAWVSAYTGGKVPARQPGEGGLKALEDAPGSYVKVK